MKQYFTVDSKLYGFMIRLLDILLLNFLWMLFSLPIITIGPATVAAYSVTMKMVDDREGSVVHNYMSAFKANIKQGIPLGLVSLVLGYSIYMNFHLFEWLPNNPIIFLIAGMVILFVSLTHLTYAYPLMACYENSFIGTLRNSSKIAMKYFSRTVALWLVIAFMCVLFMYNSTLIFIGFLVGPASVFLTVSGFAKWFFQALSHRSE